MNCTLKRIVPIAVEELMGDKEKEGGGVIGCGVPLCDEAPPRGVLTLRCVESFLLSPFPPPLITNLDSN